MLAGKIEVGKWYQSRMGQRFWVAGKLPLPAIYPYIGTNEAAISGVFWDEDGRCCDTSEYSLISEWQEPSQVKLPEKLEENYTWSLKGRNAIATSTDDKARYVINQLIDYCESLQAQITELKGKV